MTKALFFDIDGTLVSFKTHKIPQSAIDALITAKSYGMKIFIATGRPRIIINNLQPLQEQNLIDGYITMNGAYCYVGEKIIHKSSIPAEDVQNLVSFCADRAIPCIVVDEHHICACCPNERVQQIFHEHLKVTAEIPDTPMAQAIEGKEIFQLTPFITKEEELQIAPQIPHCEIGRWHPAFADVTAIENTKQRGIDEMIQYLGIRLEDTIAFGDGGNDISMLRHAGIGIAMGNANDDVKASAKYVTSSVDENGIAQAIQAIISGEWHA